MLRADCRKLVSRVNIMSNAERPENRELTGELDQTGRQLVLECTGAQSIITEQCIQTLWSGCGKIVRVTVENTEHALAESPKTVIVKYISVPLETDHPRGWNSQTSSQRKITSYQVETNWYEHYANACRHICPMPELIAMKHHRNQTWLILEDLDPVYPVRRESLTPENCVPCLQWLAKFHGYHLQSSGEKLWPEGSYWHLQTRPEEFMAMPDGPLKDASVMLDEKLSQCTWRTLVHGDAKVANICFSANQSKVAFVDFQYTGLGCGMRDVIYFLGSCLDEQQCEQYASSLLDSYFNALRNSLPASVSASVEQEWRDLYAIAWADFHRFLAGWMPNHRKINRYALAMTQKALDQLHAS